MNTFQKREFEKAGAYASDVLLGSFTPFSSPKTIPGRNCEMILSTLNHMPYHAYHHPDKMVKCFFKFFQSPNSVFLDYALNKWSLPRLGLCGFAFPQNHFIIFLFFCKNFIRKVVFLCS